MGGPPPRAPARPPGRTKGRRRPSPRRDTKAGPTPHLRRVEQALATALYEAHRETFGAAGSTPKPFPLELRMIVEPGKTWRIGADPPLEEQVRSAVREMAARAEVYRPGRAFCYRCESSACDHSLPPRPTSVFRGYSSTGLPLWTELSEVLLEQKHPQVDLLYRPAQRDLLAVYMDPDSLKRSQLGVFGKESKTYDILGQVVFGYLRLRGQRGTTREPERVAFTLQAVESRRLNGSPRVELNVLGRLSDGTPAYDALSGPSRVRLFNLIASARHRISSLCPSSRGTERKGAYRIPADTNERVADILQGLARKVERLGRQSNRRTTHAQDRGKENRPVSRAWEDARSASNDLVFWDKHEKTFVVMGPRNRVHVLTPQGRHVTSFSLAAEAVQGRMRRRRWSRLTEEQWETFRSVVQRRGQGEKPKPVAEPEAERSV